MEDDLSQLLGIKASPEQQASLKELERRSNDRLRAANPLDEDYYVVWDQYGAGGRFLIPGKTRDIGYGPGQAVHPRYIAFKFFKEITNKVLSAEMQSAIDAENKRRESIGMNRMDKTFEKGEELAFVYSRGLKPNDETKLMELLPKIILGIEQEWGMDAIPYQKPVDTIKWDEVNAIINRKVGTAQPEAPAPIMQQTHEAIPEDDLMRDIAA